MLERHYIYIHTRNNSFDMKLTKEGGSGLWCFNYARDHGGNNDSIQT